MSAKTRVRVRYAETDQMGVVYHANHFVWFEIGRVELLRQLGFSYRDMEQDDGCFIAVVDARCRYKAPARYDDEIIVRTHLKNVRESLIHFGYELVRADDGDAAGRRRNHARGHQRGDEKGTTSGKVYAVYFAKQQERGNRNWRIS